MKKVIFTCFTALMVSTAIAQSRPSSTDACHAEIQRNSLVRFGKDPGSAFFQEFFATGYKRNYSDEYHFRRIDSAEAIRIIGRSGNRGNIQRLSKASAKELQESAIYYFYFDGYYWEHYLFVVNPKTCGVDFVLEDSGEQG